MLLALLFIVLIICLVVSVPIGIALGIASLVVAFVGDIPLMILPQKFFTTNDSFPLLCIPFFMLAGSVMTAGGVSQRLVNFASSIVGSFSGGLAMVVVLGCMFFSAISGSSAATAAAIGAIMIPAMANRGYPKDFSAGITASAGALGMIIPPSMLMIVYGVAAEASIGQLFLGGFGPGIFMGLAMMVYVYFVSRKQGYSAGEKFVFRNVWVTFRECFWGLLMPVIILGGIYGGIFTPTEAAAVGAFYGFVIAMFVYKELKWSGVGEVLIDAAKATAVVMFIMNAAGFFGWLLVNFKAPQLIAEGIIRYTSDPTLLMLFVVVLLLFVGTFMNAVPAMVIMAPIFVPTMKILGIDPIFAGVVMSITLSLGCITPPVGVDLFVTSSIAKVSIEKIARSALPFIVILIICTFIMVLIPDIIMFIPSLFYK